MSSKPKRDDAREGRIWREIGQRIRTARESANLTQTELGRLVGASQPAIANWESGERSVDIPTLQRIALRTERPFEYFIPPFPGQRRNHAIPGSLSERVEQFEGRSARERREIAEMFRALVRHQDLCMMILDGVADYIDPTTRTRSGVHEVHGDVETHERRAADFGHSG